LFIVTPIKKRQHRKIYKCVVTWECMKKEKMNHYANVAMNNGNYGKQVKNFGKSLGLEKKFLRRILEDENSMIKYKIKMEISKTRVEDWRQTETNYITKTILDIYAKDEEKAKFIYNNLKELYQKINEKNGEKGLGVRIWTTLPLGDSKENDIKK